MDNLPDIPLEGAGGAIAFIEIDSVGIASIDCFEVEAIGLACSNTGGRGGEEIDMNVTS